MFLLRLKTQKWKRLAWYNNRVGLVSAPTVRPRARFGPGVVSAPSQKKQKQNKAVKKIFFFQQGPPKPRPAQAYA